MTPVDELVAREQIKELKARYFRLMDTKQWDAFAQVFTDDIVADVSEDTNAPGNAITGRQSVVDFIKGAVGQARTVHHGHTPEITFTDDTHATGIWAMADIVEFETPKGPRGIRGYGHYEESYIRTQSGWQIAKLKLTRLRIDRL